MLRQLSANALLHQVQCPGSVARFGWPRLLLQRWRVDVLRQPVRATGQLLHGPRQQTRANPRRNQDGHELEQHAQVRRPETSNMETGRWPRWPRWSGRHEYAAFLHAECVGMQRGPVVVAVVIVIIGRWWRPVRMAERCERARQWCRQWVAGSLGFRGGAAHPFHVALRTRAREEPLDHGHAQHVNGKHDRGHHEEQPHEHRIEAPSGCLQCAGTQFGPHHRWIVRRRRHLRGHAVSAPRCP